MSSNNLVSIVDSLNRWKKPILIMTALAILGSVLISLSLTDYFKASTTFYAASQDLSKPEKIMGSEEIRFYGNEEDINRIMTIANSTSLVDFMIDSFSLYEHYEIDPTAKLAKYKVRKAFTKHYEVIKTKYEAIQLSYEDPDPDFAAMIANVARTKLNQKAQNVTRDGLQQLISFHTSSIGEKEQMLKKLTDTLTYLRDKYNIYDVDAQNEVYSQLIATVSAQLAKGEATLRELKRNDHISQDTLMYQTAQVAGLKSQSKNVLNAVANFNKGKARIVLLEDQLEKLSETLSFDRIRMNQQETAANTEPKAIHLLESAEAPLRKSRPKRSLLVLGATFMTFLFTSFGVLLYEQFLHLKQ